MTYAQLLSATPLSAAPQVAQYLVLSSVSTPQTQARISKTSSMFDLTMTRALFVVLSRPYVAWPNAQHRRQMAATAPRDRGQCRDYPPDSGTKSRDAAASCGA